MPINPRIMPVKAKPVPPPYHDIERRFPARSFDLTGRGRFELYIRRSAREHFSRLETFAYDNAIRSQNRKAVLIAAFSRLDGWRMNYQSFRDADFSILEYEPHFPMRVLHGKKPENAPPH